jgi:hypothetical protein
MERTSFYGLAGRKFQKEAAASQCPEAESSDGDESWSTLSVNALLAQFRAGKGVEESSVGDSDSDSMSTITVHTISTDTMMLSHPTYAGVGGILSFIGPQADEDSVSRPIRPGRKSQHQQESGVEVGILATPDGAPNVKMFFDTVENELAHVSFCYDTPPPDPHAIAKGFDTPPPDPHAIAKGFDEEKYRRNKKIRRWMGVGLLAVLTTVGIALPLVILGSDDGEADHDAPSTKPSQTAIDATRSRVASSLAPSPQPSLRRSALPSENPSVAPSSSSYPSNVPSTSPSTKPSSAPTSLQVYILDLLSAAAPDSLISMLDDFNSPQATAFEWLQLNTIRATQPDRIILQRFALATLYYSTSGDKWRRNDGWLTEENECLWYTRSLLSPCNSLGEYTHLNLPSNSLAGSLPGELALLAPSLQTISVPTNSLIGGIPTAIGQLSKLESLNLAANAITESIPSELGQLSNLLLFSLYETRVTGQVPAELANLTNLTELYIARTSLTGELPNGVCEDLPFLQQVWADCTVVTGCECCTTCCYDDFCDAV